MQLTDFENSCNIILAGMIVNIINHFNLDFIIPISLNDENMDRAHVRNSVLTKKFWFNKNFVQSEAYWDCNLQNSDYKVSRVGGERIEPEYQEYTLQEILCGTVDENGHNFVGIMPVIKKFMQIKEYSEEQTKQINHYLDFLVARSKGEVPTSAAFIRQWIDQCPTYNHDSILSNETMNDLVKQLIKINKSENV